MREHPTWNVNPLSRLVPYVLAAGSLASTATQPAPVHAQTCGVDSDCLVRSAKCIQGACRLITSSPLLIPSLGVATITLNEPAELAQMDSGKFDVELEFPSGAAHVKVFILKRWPIYEVSGRLTNREDVVWTWDSAWENQLLRRIAYAKGKAERNEKGQCKLLQAPALSAGVYHWAAIAWDARGEVSHQSAVHSFTVRAEDMTGRDCSDDDVCESSAESFCRTTLNYCVVRCASDYDCFEGTHCDFSTVNIVGFAAGVCRDNSPLCSCDDDEFCDRDGDKALKLCYKYPTDNQGGGCGGCGNGSGGSGTVCASALMVFLDGRRRSRRRDRKDRKDL